MSTDHKLMYEEAKKRLFGTSQNEELDEILISEGYLDIIFASDLNTNLSTIIKFIEMYKSSIIKSIILDDNAKNNLIKERDIIDRTKISLLTPEFINNILTNIQNNKIDKFEIKTILYITSFINTYGLNCDPNKIKTILDNGLFGICSNNRIVGDGETILKPEEINEKTDTLLAWQKRFGLDICYNIYNLELLKERLLQIYNCDNQLFIEYKEEINNLLNTCSRAIAYRDNNNIPTEEEIAQINQLFNRYEYINKSLIIKIIENNNFALAHFVREETVNYQINNGEIVDLNAKTNNVFDKEQIDSFFNSYLNHIIPLVEKKSGEKFDPQSPKQQIIIQEYLDYFNQVFNNEPLTRLPITIREMHDFKTYIRNSDSRLSCSFISLSDNIKSHLNRKVAILLKPKNTSGILSTSYGYTSKKEYKDFRSDSLSCVDLIDQIYNSNIVNEVALDIDYCEVVGILALDESYKTLEQATRLSEQYGVPIVHYGLTDNIDDGIQL